MVWKQVANADAGDADHFGGNDIDKISQLFSGTSNVDTVDINSITTFRNGKFRLRNPANTFSYIWNTSAITSDVTITEPLLTGNDTRVYEQQVQVLSNKTFTNMTLDFTGLALPGVVQDPSAKRWGAYQPLGAGTSNSTVGILDGILESATPTGGGTASNSWDTTEGLLVSHTTSASSGTIAGLTPSTTIGQFRRAKSASISSRFAASSTTSTRAYIGFSSASTLAVSDSPLGASDHGVIVGFNTALSNFSCWRNDGVTSATTTDLAVAKDANFHTIQISWGDSGNITVSLDGANSTISTDLPGTTTNLFAHFQIQTASATARTISTRGVWLESA